MIRAKVVCGGSVQQGCDKWRSPIIACVRSGGHDCVRSGGVGRGEKSQ